MIVPPCGNYLLNGPRQCAYNVDAVFVDALEHFAEEVLVVEGAFEVVALGFDGLEGISGWSVGSRCCVLLPVYTPCKGGIRIPPQQSLR
jgi:hypothetical protein